MADPVELTTSAARFSKCARPTPAVKHTSARVASGWLVNQLRYRSATCISAAGVRAESGSTLNFPSLGCSRGSGASAGWATGASSRMTCALVPANPNELTPATRGRLLRSQGIVSLTTSTASWSHGMCGDGFSKCRCLGRVSCSSDRITLMTPAIPAAASRCPIFVFTEPINSGRPGSRPAPSTAPAAWTSIGSPSDVPVP